MYKRNNIPSLSLNMAYPESHGFMFQQLHEDNGLHLHSPTSLPSCPPQLFHGEGGNFMMMNRSMSFSAADKTVTNNQDEGEEDLSDDGSQLLGEKKKRLNLEQVRALEKSFELGNKLEPERKLQLAKALGLQPRQIAIWFQNRRARWKTKQLEKDYEALKKQFEALKADNDALHQHNKNLNSELVALRNRDCGEVPNSIKREAEVSWSNNCSDNSTSDKNLDMSRTPISIIKDLFPSSMRQTQMDHHHNQQQHQMVQEESYCNMFNGIDEQQNFWPWPDHNQQQNFN